jgi:hypothetical protein
MAYNYQAYVSKYGKKLNDLDNQMNSVYNQISNFDNTYDHTKDAGWIAADEQLKKEARIAGNNAVGKMGNRIGAISTSMQNASDSIYANALKNSQNLIPTYKEAALNKLKNQYSLLQNQYNNILSLDQQDYSRWNDKNNFDYQKYLNDLSANATSSGSTSGMSATEMAKIQLEYDKFNAENGTNLQPNFAKYGQSVTNTPVIKNISQDMARAYGDGGVSGRKNLYNYILSLDSDYSDYVEDALEKLGLNRNWFKTAATLRQKAGYGSQLMK